MATATASAVNAQSCSHCFIDLDIDDHRSKLALAAAFVDATDSRYGLSSKELRNLGGSELARIEDLMESDHEWSEKRKEGVEVRPPVHGMRIVIKLFWDIAPLACENFATLCTNGTDTLRHHTNTNTKKNSTIKPTPIGESGKPLTYKNSIFHRILPNFIAQGGDFVFHNGTGGECIFHGKKTFKDERLGLQLHHDRRGIVSMGNGGRKNSNTSQFFITLGDGKGGSGDAMRRCDGKHVVFGEVVSGFEVLDALELKGGISEGSGSDGVSLGTVRISDCGAYHPLSTPGAGFWYDKPDDTSFTGYSSIFLVRPRVAIVTPTTAVYHKFAELMGTYVAPVSVLVVSAEEGGVEASNDDQAGDGDAIVALRKAMELLSKFMVDVILVAPVYAKLVQSTNSCSSSVGIPPSWMDEQRHHLNDETVVESLEEIFIVAKPIEALSKIRDESWLRRRSSWQLDGVI